jgi:rubrerythrin
MAMSVEAGGEPAQQLAAGVRVKGEYRCIKCGYGITVYRMLPRCPMCGQEKWEQQDWSPFGRAAATLDKLL